MFLLILGQLSLSVLIEESYKGCLAIAKLKPLSLFISLLLMLKKAFYNVKIEKLKVKVVSALHYLACPFDKSMYQF